MKNQLVTMITGMMLFIALTSNAQTSNLSIQGIVKTIEGNAVENGEYDLTFKLYDVEVAGTVLWEETIEDVRINGGIYSVILGAGSTPLDVPFNVPYYLGVSVDGDIDLYPRARLTSSPYALSLIGDDNIFPNSGNVGVGASVPEHKLTVQEGDGILGLKAIEDANNTATITTTADGMSFDAGGTDKTYAFSNGKIQATAHELLTIEGTTDANLVLTNSTGSASLGFDAANGGDLQLSNPVGGITLTPMTNPVEINKNGEALKLIGTDSSFISFYPQGTSATMNAKVGFNDPDNPEQFGITTNGGNMVIDTKGGHLVVPNAMEVGGNSIIGKSWTQGYSRQTNHSGNWLSIGTGNHSWNFGLVVNDHVLAYAFWANSDQRIKTDLNLSNHQKDLNTLNQIEVTDYRHVDFLNNGDASKKGLIAQQVKAVFPEAVTLRTEHIPNIYAFATQVNATDKMVKVTLEKAHGLKVNDNVKIVIPEGEEDMLVLQVENDFSFTVSPKNIKIKKDVFVYGKEVDDFHTVDYDRVFTLNVSATQELARKVEALEKENAELKSKVTKSEDLLKSLSAKVETISQNLEMTGHN